jgi:NAD(P)H-dependent flavin oxidoreductase YrpB (nitropropane dioxygenase family)
VLAAGASAARVGTRFLATSESGAHPDYVAALLAAGQTDTLLTTAFEVGWPDAPHRVLASAVAAAEALDEETVGEVDVNGESQPVPRLAARTPSREVTGTVEAMALYAGQGVGLVNEVEGAASLVRELAEGAEALLRRWAPERAD